mgnify:CR=1 FL=1
MGRGQAGTRPSGGHSPRQQGRGTRRQQLWTPQRSHGRSERADGRHARTPQAAHSATRRAGRTAARQLKPRPQAAPQVGLAQAADARPDGQLAQTLLPASARTTRHLPWAGDVIRQRKRQRGGAGTPQKTQGSTTHGCREGSGEGRAGGGACTCPRLTRTTPHCARRTTIQATQMKTGEGGYELAIIMSMIAHQRLRGGRFLGARRPRAQHDPTGAPRRLWNVRVEYMAPGQPLRSRHDADACQGPALSQCMWPSPRRQPPLGRLLPYGASPPPPYSPKPSTTTQHT